MEDGQGILIARCGDPTVLARVLTPHCRGDFSDHSHGFREDRNAHPRVRPFIGLSRRTSSTRPGTAGSRYP